MSASLQPDPIQTNEAEGAALERLEAAFKGASPPRFIAASGEEIVLPESLFRTLREAVSYLLRGDAVFISPLHRHLSTTEAGDLLGVSRQYLTRLIDSGEIPCDRIGRHRRLRLKDVLEYQARRSKKRQAIFARMTSEDATDGIYD
jgi:excisionase family DNA binding protein